MIDYAELLEHYAGLGYSAAAARTFAGNGIVPRADVEPDEDEEEWGGCTCPIGSEYCTC